MTKDLADMGGLVDFVVRFTKPGSDMRTQVLRVIDEAQAISKALDAVGVDGPWAGWSILDVSTMAEAQARYRGQR